jgi:hypothetical protein
MGTKDHLRTAIQLLSREVPIRTFYAHLGWRRIGERWAYLHAGGAIGTDGPIAGIEVHLPDALVGYELPPVPRADELIDSIRTWFELLRLAPDRIMFTLLGAVSRTVLGACDFSVHLSGPTGVFKSELAALCQQHFGSGMNARHLPANWSSTANALEGLAFAAKDALLVVDDFAPSGSAYDVQRYHREADRLFRAQGNHSGRQRMRADASLRPTKPPRGMILSTGEDVPRGQSLRARILVIELEGGDVDRKQLTRCQQDAAAGVCASVLAGFLRWLAPQYAIVRERLHAEIVEMRRQVLDVGPHARSPEILANLALGLRYFLNFTQEAGVLGDLEAGELWQRGWQALRENAVAQASHHEAAEPTGRFLRLVGAALASGRAHVAGPDGGEPEDRPESWGWRQLTIGTGSYARDEWQPQGRRIGWIDADNLYLEPEAAFVEAQEMASKQGESLPIAARTLHKRLKEKGLLASTDEARNRILVRRTLEGARREVLHLRADLLAQKDVPNVPMGPTDSDFARNGPVSWDVFDEVSP